MGRPDARHHVDRERPGRISETQKHPPLVKDRHATLAGAVGLRGHAVIDLHGHLRCIVRFLDVRDDRFPDHVVELHLANIDRVHVQLLSPVLD